MSSVDSTRVPILSFDYNTFMERGSMMSREHVLLRLGRQQLVLHSTPPRGRHDRPTSRGLSHVRDQLFHYTNPWYLPAVYRSQWLDQTLSRYRSVHRRLTLRKIGGTESPVLYVWHPHFSDELGRYGESAVVYHIYDDYATLPGSHSDWAEKELRLLERADLVFVANEKLLDRCRSVVDRKYIHLPQGVDFAAFEDARRAGAPAPDDLASIRRPRIGYIGRLNAKVDLDLVTALAGSRREWSFIFVGPVDASTTLEAPLRRLRALDNVHFLGVKPFESIPGYWLHLDVAIVPYRTAEGQWAHFGSPLKLREALAAGKPLVVAPLHDFGPIRDLLRMASTPAEWEHEIASALASDEHDPSRARALSYAASNSWDRRVDEIRSHIESVVRHSVETAI